MKLLASKAEIHQAVRPQFSLLVRFFIGKIAGQKLRENYCDILSLGDLINPYRQIDLYGDRITFNQQFRSKF